MTNLELITGSLQDLGEVGQGETISPEDGAFGLDRLNELLLSLSNDRLNIPAISSFTGNLLAGIGTYTLGPSGVLVVSIRPVLIQTASIVISGLSHDLDLISAPAYNAIEEQGLTGQLPLKLWPNGTMPDMTLKFWPIPVATPQFTANYWGIIGGGATALSDSLLVPPGYFRALRTVLAIEMAPGYGRQPSEALAAAYKDSYALIRNHGLLDTVIAQMPIVSPSRGEPGPIGQVQG